MYEWKCPSVCLSVCINPTVKYYSCCLGDEIGIDRQKAAEASDITPDEARLDLNHILYVHLARTSIK